MAQYPYIIEHSSSSTIVALSDTEVGKVMLPSNLRFVDAHTGKEVDFLNEMPKLENEAAALQYANSINGLMPAFIRLQSWQAQDGQTHDMMVMERLYPLPAHHFDVQVRMAMMQEFEKKMEQLHDNNFVHGDLMRPTNYFTRGNMEWMFGNIVQTESGLRLIDAGFGTICKKENIKLFVSILIREREEIAYFRKYYLKEAALED